MILLPQIKLKVPVTDEAAALRKACEKLLHVDRQQLREIKILKKSLDARKKPELMFCYQIAVMLDSGRLEQKLLRQKKAFPYEPVEYHFPVKIIPSSTERDTSVAPKESRPVIVGTGPAGLFCGYMLSQAGLRPILLERGLPVEERQKAVETFWEKGILLPNTNVQFGEGGAGTFSDGKLQTQVKDKSGRIAKILDIFIEHGAPEEIRYLNKPHIGTDLLAGVVANMREHMIQMGAEFRFETVFEKPVMEHGALCSVLVSAKGKQETIPASCCILCTGHSARDTFLHLYDAGMQMENKPFAVGFRIQHSQAKINACQYGEGYEKKHLPAADYKLTYQQDGRNVYSFCMCPGGYVVNASSEEGKLAVNGMSYHARASENANSAIVLSVTEKDYGDGLFDGMRFQETLEKKAYALGGGKIPVERYGDFRSGVLASEGNRSSDRIKTDLVDAAQTSGSSKGNAFSKGREYESKKNGQSVAASGVQAEETVHSDSASESCRPVMKGELQYADLTSLLPKEMNVTFLDAMDYFGKILPGFDAPGALLAGVETRTSSPVRMVRDDGFESNLKGIFPCGEGAGYAGGITSAALDGIKVAESVAMRYTKG